MFRFLAQTVLVLLGNALGLIVAALFLPDFHLSAVGFIWSVVFFTAAQVILAPFIFKMAVDYMPAFRGGVALVTILVVLVLTTLFTGGLTITGVVAWVLASLIIWLTTILAGILLPLFIFKKTLGKVKDSRSNAAQNSDTIQKVK